MQISLHTTSIYDDIQRVKEYFKRMEMKDGIIKISPSAERLVKIDEKLVIFKTYSQEDKQKSFILSR